VRRFQAPVANSAWTNLEKAVARGIESSLELLHVQILFRIDILIREIYSYLLQLELHVEMNSVTKAVILMQPCCECCGPKVLHLYEHTAKSAMIEL
jgi:hypothetical protein